MIRKIYKFGGASVKDADAVRNLKSIIEKENRDELILVVSAMGKTTNAIEKALAEFRKNNGHLEISALSEIIEYHEKIMIDLFEGNTSHPIFEVMTNLFLDLYLNLQETGFDYDYQYDNTVSFGEILSTTLISTYLNECGIKNELLDAREYIITDHNFRAANPNWDDCRLRIQKLSDNHDGTMYITQGFIAGTISPKTTTTLGREGSDFTAAIFANCMDAQEVTIWKDVDGVRNADPKRFPNTQKISHLSYLEAIELAFYGASIIHPKTLKPLQNKNIPLKVKSFVDTSLEPTIIDNTEDYIEYVPSFIVKEKQTLMSITARDFSFMNEHNRAIIFNIMDELNLHANMTQVSALVLSICFDENEKKKLQLIETLSQSFKIKYNDGLQLFTIRHYHEGLEKDFVKDKKIYIEQRSRSTYQIVLE
ncbi:MAG: aspartate kinase [Bacteroidales bacterium]|nr:aspartate kinase [Bacteroidales bacterium]